MSSVLSDNFHARLTGSEMADRVHAYDWSATALGSPSQWHESLRMALEICLTSHFPIAVWWGADLIQFYNDGYRPILGTLKHPEALGKPARETWTQIWPTIGPLVDQVILEGRAAKGDDVPLTLERNATMEQCHITFWYSPIFDKAGQVAGIFTAALDTTARVVSERRLSIELALADQLRGLATADEIADAATKLLITHLNVSRAFYAELDDESETFRIPLQWTVAAGLPNLPATGHIQDFGTELLSSVQAGKTFIVENFQTDRHMAPYASVYSALGIEAIVVLPLVKAGRLLANFNVTKTTPHCWTTEEIGLIRYVGERTWDAIERTRAELALRTEHAQSQYIFDSMTEGFAVLDQHWNVLRMNSAGLRIAQYSTCEVIGRNLWDIWPALKGTEAEAMYRLAMEENVAGNVEMLHALPDAEYIWLEVRAYPSLDNGLAFFFRDITNRKQAEEKVRYAALHDALTGLPNRPMLFEYAAHVLPHNKRTGQSAALLYLDLDRFKPVNDTHGHETGDFLLKQVADRLCHTLRAEDIVVRLGGDEFLILLQDIRHASYAADVAHHILEKISMPFHTGELMLSLSASIGISLYPGDGENIDTLISHADAAMYQAKHAGRNNFQFYSPHYAAGAKIKLIIEQQLRLALRTDAFLLCYQPVVDLKTRRTVSAEALLRLKSDDVGPDQFVPIAEATGIINPIGRWVLQEASRQHKKWIASGLPALPIAVNVSVVEFRDRNFVGHFKAIIDDNGIDASALQLELTETAVMDDIEHAITVLSMLKALGVKILLDDFGTGHSSLQYLARLPLNKMKIDKSFVGRLEQDIASRAVTDAMLALGHTLNLEMVAEGVESAAMLEYIELRGCQQAQGYFFGRPMTGDVFEEWYRQSQQT